MRTIATTGLLLSLLLVAACAGSGESRDPGDTPPAETNPVAHETMTYTIDVQGMT